MEEELAKASARDGIYCRTKGDYTGVDHGFWFFFGVVGDDSGCGLSFLRVCATGICRICASGTFGSTRRGAGFLLLYTSRHSRDVGMGKWSLTIVSFGQDMFSGHWGIWRGCGVANAAGWISKGAVSGRSDGAAAPIERVE